MGLLAKKKKSPEKMATHQKNLVSIPKKFGLDFAPCAKRRLRAGR